MILDITDAFLSTTKFWFSPMLRQKQHHKYVVNTTKDAP